jgi:hypothetical protein
VILPHALAFTLPAAPAAAIVGRTPGTSPGDVPGALQTLAADLAAPTDLTSLGIPTDGLAGLVRQVLATSYASPQPVTAGAVPALLDRAMAGRHRPDRPPPPRAGYADPPTLRGSGPSMVPRRRARWSEPAGALARCLADEHTVVEEYWLSGRVGSEIRVCRLDKPVARQADQVAKLAYGLGRSIRGVREQRRWRQSRLTDGCGGNEPVRPGHRSRPAALCKSAGPGQACPRTRRRTHRQRDPRSDVARLVGLVDVGTAPRSIAVPPSTACECACFLRPH